MQIFLNLFGTRGRAPCVLVKYLLIDARVCKSEVDRAGKCFPHLASKTIWKTDLDQPGTLGVP